MTKKIADMTPEELAARKWLKMLAWGFTCGVAIRDIPYIRYKAYRKKGKVTSLYLTDLEHRLGNMYCDFTPSVLSWSQWEGVSLDDLLAFLIANGAKERPREKRVRMMPLYD